MYKLKMKATKGLTFVDKSHIETYSEEELKLLLKKPDINFIFNTK